MTRNRVMGRRAFPVCSLFLCMVCLVFFMPSGGIAKAAEFMIDEEIVDTYQAETGLLNAPAVISRVRDKNALDKLNAAASAAENVRPAGVILNFDREGRVKGEGGTVLGTFREIYSALNHRIIPIVCISDGESANTLIDFLTHDINILDMTVMSANPALIKAVRSAVPGIRGALLCAATDNLYKDIITAANACCANIVVLPVSMSTGKNVAYIQKRFKTVWATVEGVGDLDYYRAVNCGAYGMVTDDYEKAYDVLKTYPENSSSRASFVVGHRGTPHSKNQNSVSGLKNAAATGISHVEFDVYLTTDKEVVLMHNYTLDETCNVETVNGGVDAGKHIETMSLPQIRQYQLDQFGMEPIPILSDILEELVKTDVIFILEIKSLQSEIVPLIKAQLDRYDCYDQVVVISFNLPILEEVKKAMPGMPTSYLGDTSVNQFKESLKRLGAYNTNVDTNFGTAGPELNAMLRDRGYICWSWTYATGMAVKRASHQGLVGLTTDAADSYVDHPNRKFLCPDHIEFDTEAMAQVKNRPAAGDKVPLIMTMYNGATFKVEGTVIASDETEKGYNVAASYLYKSAYSTKDVPFDEVIFPDVLFIEKEVPEESSKPASGGTSGGGCEGFLGFKSGMVLPLSLATLLICIYKKRKGTGKSGK